MSFQLENVAKYLKEIFSHITKSHWITGTDDYTEAHFEHQRYRFYREKLSLRCLTGFLIASRSLANNTKTFLHVFTFCNATKTVTEAVLEPSQTFIMELFCIKNSIIDV